jgi:hypothetical protein
MGPQLLRPVPQVQKPAAQVAPGPHCVPQPPQWFESTLSSTQPMIGPQ